MKGVLRMVVGVRVEALGCRSSGPHASGGCAVLFPTYGGLKHLRTVRWHTGYGMTVIFRTGNQEIAVWVVYAHPVDGEQVLKSALSVTQKVKDDFPDAEHIIMADLNAEKKPRSLRDTRVNSLFKNLCHELAVAEPWQKQTDVTFVMGGVRSFIDRCAAPETGVWAWRPHWTRGVKGGHAWMRLNMLPPSAKKSESENMAWSIPPHAFFATEDLRYELARRILRCAIHHGYGPDRWVSSAREHEGAREPERSHPLGVAKAIRSCVASLWYALGQKARKEVTSWERIVDAIIASKSEDVVESGGTQVPWYP